MLVELLTRVEVNISTIRTFNLGTGRIIHKKDEDYSVITDGLFLFCGILAEVAHAYLTVSEFSTFKGRLLKGISAWEGKGYDYLMTYLDASFDCLIRGLSDESGDFKGPTLLKELARMDSQCVIWPILGQVVRRLFEADGEGASVATAKELFQLFSLLRKIAVARMDLVPEMESAFFEKEFLLSQETEFQRRRYPNYVSLVSRVRDVLSPLINSFSIDYLVPRHGPGAVSLEGVRHKRDKYASMAYSPHVDYMLRKTGLGSSDDYWPSTGLTTRESRYICVPKTWKSLRGISAEPPELQYYQQGLRQWIESGIRDHFLSCIDLQDQGKSRSMTLLASRTGSYATIDLSEASDSVTVQLVRDIFGNSLLARWLMATRSSSTRVNSEISVKTKRFAPMGSSVCFPVECLIFAGISLAVARSNILYRDWKQSDIRVFGDDIIIPTELTAPVCEALHLAGFSVNSGKSFSRGYFRESCGEFAWKGKSITPFRFKKVDGGLLSSRHSYEKTAQAISIFNSLEARGYHATRSYLLSRFMSGNVKIGSRRVSASQQLVFSPYGDRKTVMSTHPTNFHLWKKTSVPLQELHIRCVEWVPKSAGPHQIDDSYLYQEWLLLKQKANLDQRLPVYDLDFFRSLNSASEAVETTQMVPVFTWKSEYSSTRQV